VAGNPLVEYQTGGNAGETAVGTVGTPTLFGYTFTLPTSFPAAAGERYWIQIEASQQGPLPDWCLALVLAEMQDITGEAAVRAAILCSVPCRGTRLFPSADRLYKGKW
jgi:hypothetical protein